MKLADILRLLSRYLFPEFTNKLTWAVTGAGLLLISSTLIEQIVRDFIISEFKLELTGANDAYVGLVLIVAGLLHNYGFQREKTARLKDPSIHAAENRKYLHEEKQFKKLDNYLHEQYLKQHLNNILTDHSYYGEEKDPILRFLYHGLDAENIFINDSINSHIKELHKALSEFFDFRSESFFQHGPVIEGRPMRFCMYPALTWDRGGSPTQEQEQKYAELALTLNEKVVKVENAFENYRKAIRSELAL